MPWIEWSSIKYNLLNGRVVNLETDSGVAEIIPKGGLSKELLKIEGTDGFLYKFNVKNSGEGNVALHLGRRVHGSDYYDDDFSSGLTTPLTESFCRSIPVEGGLDFANEDVKLTVTYSA